MIPVLFIPERRTQWEVSTSLDNEYITVSLINAKALKSFHLRFNRFGDDFVCRFRDHKGELHEWVA